VRTPAPSTTRVRARRPSRRSRRGPAGKPTHFAHYARNAARRARDNVPGPCASPVFSSASFHGPAQIPRPGLSSGATRVFEGRGSQPHERGVIQVATPHRRYFA
jgi:hypothetical protein